jgi:membrane protein implicated in regulation of membrane protease activity
MSARSRARKDKSEIEWDFYTFPVLFGIFIGAFIAVIFFPFVPLPVFVVSLFGLSFCLAHAMTHWFRRWRGDKKKQQADEDERERRALATRAAAAQAGAPKEEPRPRRRRRRGKG